MILLTAKKISGPGHSAAIVCSERSTFSWRLYLSWAALLLWLPRGALAQTPQVGLSVIQAVQAVLANNPNLRVQVAQVQIARGLKEQASGAFNPALQVSTTHAFSETVPIVDETTGYAPLLSVTEISNITTVSASLSKLYRNGITVAPSFQLQRTTDSFLAPAGYDTQASSVTVTFPLLQGRGAKVVDAKETAAEQEIAAAGLDLSFLVSELSVTGATDYWNFLAALRSLAVAKSAEDRGRVYVENTQALIDANHVPPSDINQINANLAQQTSNRIAAEQGVLAARQQLALDMALAPAEILMGVSDPSDDFPSGPEAAVPRDDVAALTFYFEQALARRADYLAAKNRTEQASILLVPARNGVLPALNVQSAVGYQTAQPGRSAADYFGTPFVNARGPNASLGVYYTFPLGNQAAKGALLEAQAAVTQSQARLTQTAQGIAQAIVVAVEGLRNASLELRKTRQAVAFSDTSLQGAREKYRAGIGSTVEILQIEDRLNTVLSAQISAELTYALALVQFRFATGTLAEAGSASTTLAPDALFTLPFGPGWQTRLDKETRQ